MSIIDHFRRNRKAPRRTFTRRLAILAVCSVALLYPQIANSALPTQNVLDPRHLDLDPVGGGILVGPGETLSQVFADNLNSAEDWYAELLIGNPTSNASAVSFAADLVWPGGSKEGTISLQPGFAYLLQVEPVDVPETRPNWLFNLKNPTSVPLIFDSSVSEATSVTIPPEFGEVFVAPNGNLVPPGGGNLFTPGNVVGDFVSVRIVPEPVGMALVLIAASATLLMRRRPKAS
jgi:hypothetical protein